MYMPYDMEYANHDLFEYTDVLNEVIFLTKLHLNILDPKILRGVGIRIDDGNLLDINVIGPADVAFPPGGGRKQTVSHGSLCCFT